MQLKRALITGGNRGLGFEIAKRLINKGWQVSVTARNASECRAIFQNEELAVEQVYEVDLFNADTKCLETVFNSMGQMDVIVHAASPYMRTPLHQCTMIEIDQYTKSMANDQKIAKLALNHFIKAQKGVLAFTGAIIGMPGMDMLGEMSLVKAHERKIASVCEHEAQQLKLNEIFVRHFNLGTFARPDVSYFADIESFYMDTGEVADNVVTVISAPQKYPHNINMYRPEEAKIYSLTEESHWWMFDKTHESRLSIEFN